MNKPTVKMKIKQNISVINELLLFLIWGYLNWLIFFIIFS